MKKLVRKILDRTPYISSLRRKVNDQGLYPAGHYYSPIPAKSDVAAELGNHRASPLLADVHLRTQAQFALLEEYSQYYKELPFPEQKTEAFRYYFQQEWFRYADAIFLYSFIRHFKPRRIIEIGSGFSSAVMLDTLERFPYGKVELTFIEPYPERLLATLFDKDKPKVDIIQKKVQDVDPDLFRSIGPGDLLFVDSSHVLKYGSDLQKIFFEILPQLPAGSFVHFHDIFFPFEYPSHWLAEGRYWNEDYFLHAFLAYNETWAILFFGHYATIQFQAYMKQNMPLCVKDPGGSLYLQRTDHLPKS